MIDSIVAEPNQGIDSTLEILEARWFLPMQAYNIVASKLGRFAAVISKEIQ